jgi:hypothetical protein
MPALLTRSRGWRTMGVTSAGAIDRANHATTVGVALKELVEKCHCDLVASIYGFESLKDLAARFE